MSMLNHVIKIRIRLNGCVDSFGKYFPFILKNYINSELKFVTRFSLNGENPRRKIYVNKNLPHEAHEALDNSKVNLKEL